jgi:hypothetical protein
MGGSIPQVGRPRCTHTRMHAGGPTAAAKMLRPALALR